ncbi:MAG: 4-hydroxy-3-methylbut-2-enyl diphosphate reductase [Erysipelotrichaceae bacterium]
MKVIKVTPRGYCKGVVNAINIAKQTKLDYPTKNIYILGMLVHNSFVNAELNALGIITVENTKKSRLELLDEINDGVVIFTAHGVSSLVHQKALDKNLICIDASCQDVIKTQNIISEYIADDYDVIYIGKNHHPEAEAICELSNRVHLIEDTQDLFELGSLNKVFVTNQTTMSYLDVESMFKLIKDRYPKAIFSSEICNATMIRQRAVMNLTNVDVLYVVGDTKSNNSNRLAAIGREQGINKVYLIDSIADVNTDQYNINDCVAITSGASTPTYLTNEVINYFESL